MFGVIVDAIVTEYGITINPNRKDLIDACSEIKDVPVVSMEELIERSLKMVGNVEPVLTTDRIIGVVEWRDGTVIDVVYEIDKYNTNYVRTGYGVLF